MLFFLLNIILIIQMWNRLFIITILFAFIRLVFTNQISLEQVFTQRTHSDWQEHWHQESYSKCKTNLIRHLYWACEKDIYRLSRRNQVNGIANQEQKRDMNIWGTKKTAWQFLRTRRTPNTITTECCTRRGCTWEEYAEYCPLNKRVADY